MRSVKNWMPPFFRHPSIPPRPTRVEGEDSRDFVEIYRPGEDVEILNSPATLSGENVLPGFVLHLKGIL